MADVKERRHEHRRAGSWPLRLWLSHTYCLSGRAVGVGRHTISAHFNRAPGEALTPGQSYYADVNVGGREPFSCVVVVRLLEGLGAEFETDEDLPIEMLAR